LGTVRAAVLEGPRSMSVRTLDTPELGAEDGLLAVELVGVCGTDYKFYSGTLEANVPMILGHEILGRVEALGPGGEGQFGVQVGDRVLVEANLPCWGCAACQTGQYRFCAKRRGYGTRTSINEAPALWGAMAERMYLAPGAVLHRVPEHLPARTVMTAGLVANGIQWLRTSSASVTVGDTVLIAGVGPQALAAICVARECGAGTIIVTGLAKDEARLRLATELGADHTIVADTDDVGARVHALTRGTLADVVLEVTGDPGSISQCMYLIRPQGVLVLGGLTGRDRTTALHLDHFVWNEIRIQGVFSKGADAVSRGIRFLERVADRYPLDRIVSHVFSLEEAETAVCGVFEDPPADFIKSAVAPSGA
jgi:alcohol dehydrogenase